MLLLPLQLALRCCKVVVVVAVTVFVFLSVVVAVVDGVVAVAAVDFRMRQSAI